MSASDNSPSQLSSQPSQVLTDNVTISSSGESGGVRITEDSPREDGCKEIAHRTRLEKTPSDVEVLPDYARSADDDGQSLSPVPCEVKRYSPPRNSVLIRHGFGRFSTSKKPASPGDATPLIDDLKGESQEQESPKGKEETGDQYHNSHSNTKAKPTTEHTQSNERKKPVVRQNIWNTIGVLQKNVHRLTAANSMQEVLSYAVASYYSGVGFKALDSLRKIQDDARRIELRIINAQAQLWRAIILDELGQFDLIPELLADALFLAASSPDQLPHTDVPPEDADFYQLWRMVWVRGHWYGLWSYLKQEDAKEFPDLPPQDLETHESQIEAQEWLVEFLSRLKSCFDRTQWPVFDQNGKSIPPSQRNTMTFKRDHVDRYAEHIAPDSMAQQLQLMAQRLHDLQIKDLSNVATIEKLQNDNLRYKAEREVFDSNLSTGRTQDGKYPQQGTRSWSDLFSNPAADMNEPEAAVNEENFHQEQIIALVHEHKEARPSAALGPDQVELLAQRLRNGTPAVQRQGNQHSSPKPHVRATASHHSTVSIQKQLPHRLHSNTQHRPSRHPNRISHWLQQALEWQLQANTSLQGDKFHSPNSIPPSSPSSGRSFRNRSLLSPWVNRSSPGYGSHNEQKLIKQTDGFSPMVQKEVDDSKSHRSLDKFYPPRESMKQEETNHARPYSSVDKFYHPKEAVISPSAAQLSMLDDMIQSISSDTLDAELEAGVRLDSTPVTPDYDAEELVKSQKRLQDISAEHKHDADHSSPEPDPHSSASYDGGKSASLKRDTVRKAMISPESVSPLTSPEDVPFTDTPGGSRLEEATSHIRAHQEQRRRSTASTSSDGEETSDAAVGQHTTAVDDSHQRREVPSHSVVTTSSAQSSQSSGGVPLRSTDKHTNKSSSTEDTFHTCKSTQDIPNAKDSLCGSSKASSGVDHHASQMDMTDNTQPQNSRKASGSWEGALRLKMPISVSIPNHTRRGSVVPASPSPLRSSFSHSAADEGLKGDLAGSTGISVDE